MTAFESTDTKHYFVDEAGDPTLFARQGKVLVGSEGCSRFFIVGLADVENPAQLAAELNTLRTKLLADPYFKDVPSMQTAERKTALLFHAKDDLPEVRREVFALIQRHPIHFSAIARDKRHVLAYVRRRNETDAAYRYNPRALRLHGSAVVQATPTPPRRLPCLFCSPWHCRSHRRIDAGAANHPATIRCREENRNQRDD